MENLGEIQRRIEPQSESTFSFVNIIRFQKIIIYAAT